MAYTYKTEQFGMSGAIGSIFKDGVFVWSTDMVQAFGHYDTDRKRAARIVRERIARLKQLDCGPFQGRALSGMDGISPNPNLNQNRRINP